LKAKLEWQLIIVSSKALKPDPFNVGFNWVQLAPPYLFRVPSRTSVAAAAPLFRFLCTFTSLSLLGDCYVVFRSTREHPRRGVAAQVEIESKN
jgi:hypothetical protein